VRSAVSTAMRTINQRAEHSSPLRENLRPTRVAHEMEVPRPVHSLCFLFAHVLSTR
jgi:hypothetical protein